MTRLHWIEMPGRLAIMARPRADDSGPELDVTDSADLRRSIWS